MDQPSQASPIVGQDALRESYLPDKIFARESQIKEILQHLSPLQKRCKPLNLWLYGPPGAGKTATALYVLRELKEKANISSILVNCWEKNSFYDILDDIILQLRILRAEEHRTSLKLDKLRKHLSGSSFVVVLDEIDRLKASERATVLYNLDSLGSVGLVCISNSRQALLELEERVRSRLSVYSVYFPAYAAEDTAEILADRAQLALTEGLCSEQTLKQIAQIACGDARVAIRSLQAAAQLAESEKLDAICVDTLKKQWDNAREAKQDYLLASLTEDHRTLHRIVKQKGQILSGDLWQEYLQHCEQVKRKPLAPRTFSDYVNNLAHTGLITSERARMKGKVRLFKIATYSHTGSTSI
jgi:orc1/cdc6 family replication initiation protein